MPANALRPKDAYLHPPGAQLGTPTPAGWWAEIANSPKCREALQVALAEMVMRQQAATVQDAANNAYRLEGAKALIHILLNLGEPDLPSVLPEPKKLHNV